VPDELVVTNPGTRPVEVHHGGVTRRIRPGEQATLPPAPGAAGAHLAELLRLGVLAPAAPPGTAAPAAQVAARKTPARKAAAKTPARKAAAKTPARKAAAKTPARKAPVRKTTVPPADTAKLARKANPFGGS
jgi:hypothetical protein